MSSIIDFDDTASIFSPPTHLLQTDNQTSPLKYVLVDYSKQLFEIDAYELLKETVEYKAMQEIISTIPNSTPCFKKGIVKLTSFGQSFCTTCIKQN